MPANFVHLRLHSAYSLAESTLRIKDISELVADDKQPAAAITDTNNMFGALEFAQTLSRAGIQPIMGAQINLKDLQGQGEVVLLAKDEVGFKEVGFTSNCSVLTEKMTLRLLEAGLNCIIPSIDGLTAEVHEAIRPRTNYEKIVKNVQNFIIQRDKMNAKCKVLVRMVRQQLNKDQWDDYNVF